MKQLHDAVKAPAGVAVDYRKKVEAALRSGLLRVGAYYSLRMAQHLIDQFHLLGPDYSALWFEPVWYVPVGQIRFHPDESPPPPLIKTMVAWRLYNTGLYHKVWGMGPYGVPPDENKPSEPT